MFIVMVECGQFWKKKNSNLKTYVFWLIYVNISLSLNILPFFLIFAAVWNQYDDTIFSSPNFFEKVCNFMPFLKSMDPVEGRIIATRAMLPPWEEFITDEVDTSLTARDAIEIIKNLAYCMTQTQAEEHGLYKSNVPESFDFNGVGHHFINCYPHSAELLEARESRRLCYLFRSECLVVYYRLGFLPK